MIKPTKEISEICLKCPLPYHSDQGITYCHWTLEQPKDCPLKKGEKK